jgi:hypothetical protein
MLRNAPLRAATLVLAALVAALPLTARFAGAQEALTADTSSVRAEEAPPTDTSAVQTDETPPADTSAASTSEAPPVDTSAVQADTVPRIDEAPPPAPSDAWPSAVALPLERTHVVDLRDGYDERIRGGDAQDELGIALGSGDWDGDGIDDLAVGAWFSDSYSNERPNAGEVYILLGRRVAHRDAPGRRGARLVYGAHEGDRIGTASASGDWDGDGIADLAIAARFAGAVDDTLPQRTGLVMILYGGAPAESVREIVDLEHEADVVIRGAEEGDRLGRAVHFADLDSDGFDDLLAAAVDGDGAKNGQRDCGEVYCIWGQRLGGERQEIDLFESPGWRIDGVDPNDGMGRNIDTGDVDGDGISDIVLTATFADGAENARTNAGDTYILFGGARERWIAKVRLSRDADCVLFGGDSYEYSGASLAVADLDGDGVDDIAIGANLADEAKSGRDMCGAVYFMKGRARGEWKRRYDLGNDADVTLHGKKKGEQIGLTLAPVRWRVGPILDLAIGACLAAAEEPPRERAGRAFVFPGRQDLFAAPGARLVLDDVAGRIIEGPGARDQAGFSLGRVAWGEEGRDALVIGAPFADGPRDERADAGEVYLVVPERAPKRAAVAP